MSERKTYLVTAERAGEPEGSFDVSIEVSSRIVS
jgi:hypothetical protein